VEDGALPHQGQDEGDARADRRRDVRPHVLHRRLLRARRCALRGGALLRILADAGQPIDELLADVPPFVSTPEIRVDTDDAIKFDIVADAVPHFRARYDVIDVDGVRVLFGDGWGLMRASNTQPVLVLRFEARSEERLAEIRGEFEQWLRARGVDPTPSAHG
jgi:phosphomannomutase / phosphoglucomutase